MPFSNRTPAWASAKAKLAATVIWGDRLLRFCVRWGVPLALGFVILSGPVLPHIGGGLAPYPGLRSLHALAGLGLILAGLYQGAVWGFDAVMERAKGPRRARRPAIAPHDRARLALAAISGVLLVAMLWSGIERYAGQRWGRAVLPVLSPTEWSLVHRLVAPYYLAALLLYWFIKSRLAWRSLLDQLRRP